VLVNQRMAKLNCELGQVLYAELFDLQTWGAQGRSCPAYGSRQAARRTRCRKPGSRQWYCCRRADLQRLSQRVSLREGIHCVMA
jgi:hypothetical protein